MPQVSVTSLHDIGLNR
jgi:hypothetical protein